MLVRGYILSTDENPLFQLVKLPWLADETEEGEKEIAVSGNCTLLLNNLWQMNKKKRKCVSFLFRRSQHKTDPLSCLHDQQSELLLLLLLCIAMCVASLIYSLSLLLLLSVSLFLFLFLSTNPNQTLRWTHAANIIEQFISKTKLIFLFFSLRSAFWFVRWVERTRHPICWISLVFSRY